MDLSIRAQEDIINYMRADRAEIGERSEPMKSEQNCTRYSKKITKYFGDDALRGDTRSHPEHDG